MTNYKENKFNDTKMLQILSICVS